VLRDLKMEVRSYWDGLTGKKKQADEKISSRYWMVIIAGVC
jgi:hypothetical protein